MAIAFAALSGGTGNNNSNATSYVTGSVTLTANRLYFLQVTSRKTASAADTPTVSGWTQIDTQLQADNNNRITLFRQVPGSTVTGTHTIDFGGNTQLNCQWIITEITGSDISGTNGSGAIVQTNKGNIASGTTPSLAFGSAFGHSSHGTYGGIVCPAVSADTFISPDSNMSEIAEISATGAEAGHQQAQSKVGEEATVDWTFSSAAASSAIIVEVKSLTAATGAPSLPALTASGSATQTQSATGTPSLPQLTASGSATHTASGASATGAPSLPQLTASGAAVQTQSATGAPSLPQLTASGVGVMQPSATGAPSLPQLTASGNATQTLSATGTPSLPALTASGAAVQSYVATGAPTLPQLTATGAAESFGATGAPTLPQLTASGAATQTQAATGAPSLPQLTASGTASSLMIFTGSGAPSLPALTASGVAEFLRRQDGKATMVRRLGDRHPRFLGGGPSPSEEIGLVQLSPSQPGRMGSRHPGRL